MIRDRLSVSPARTRALLIALASVFVVSSAQARGVTVGGSSAKAKRQRAAQKARRDKRPKRIGPRSRRNFYQLTDGPGYRVRFPDRAWGTFVTVTRLQDAMAKYRQLDPSAPLVFIHDISVRNGGRLRPHVSHRNGHDVDIRLVLKNTTEYRDASPRTLDLPRNWALVKALLSTGGVKMIFLDYRLQRALYQYALNTKRVPQAELDQLFQFPRGKERTVGVIRHESGHKNHLHIRFERTARPALPIS